jgi:glycosyltransferase involved in cell wall biosynthesis
MPDDPSRTARPLNILHVGKYFLPFRGGLENYLRDLMAALGRRGISSAALVHRHDGSGATRDQTVALDGREFQVVAAGTLTELLFTPISPGFPWHLRRLIGSFKPDILLLHLPNPSVFWALPLPSARRIPWVVHWHADVITETQGRLMTLMYALYRPLERAVLKRAKAIVATSEPYRDSSEPLQPWLAKCRVVPLGMDASRLPGKMRPAPEPAGPEPQMARRQTPGLRVLAVGRLTYYKGLRYLIEAAALVENLRLDLVGQGSRAVELHALVASLKLQDRVTFHGAADDRELARLLAACDCLCLPSIERTEAFGMVLLEAMCFGKATVASDIPGSGMGWIVDHGVTGLKVEPADAAALAAAFRQLDLDRKALGEMGRRGKEKFDRLFEIDHAIEGIVDTYRAVLADLPGLGKLGDSG